MIDPQRRQRPHGVDDLFDEQAAIKVALEQRIHTTFEHWGYRRIILPTFGYYESLTPGASAQLQQQMIRFFDREGHILALRTDMTVPAARLVGTRLYDQPLPLRFYYSGSVFRHEKPQAGQRHEFTQAGIELVGAATPEADAEVVSLAVAALQACGIAEFQINLGQIAYLRAVLDDIGLSNGEQSELEQAIGRKNDLEMAQTLKALNIEGDSARLITALPHLYGGVEVLEKAHDLATNAAAREAVAHLESVYALLVAEGVAEHVILDLGEVRNMAYYTGIAFRGYVQGLGFHVCSGGRYDDLIANFGPDLPAVGFALGIERAMLVTQMAVDLTPDLVISTGGLPEGHALAAWARECSLRVEIDVLSRHGDALLAFSRSRHAQHVVDCGQETNCLMLKDGTWHNVPIPELYKEIERWSR